MNPIFRTAPVAAAAALSLLLAACGGGGDPSTGTPDSPSQAEATADASTGTQTATASASAFDAVYDTTLAAAADAATAMGTAGRARAQAAGSGAPVASAVVDCAGGGTATLTIAGGTLAEQLDGRPDAGERYTVVYAQCSGQLGLARLTGSVELDVVSVSTDAAPVTTATLALNGLSASTALGSTTLDGSATLERSATTDGTATTTRSHVTAVTLALGTAFNGRSGHFTLADVDWLRTVSADAGVVTGAQFSGHHTLSGAANGFAFSQTVSTTGAVSYDAAGAPVAGQWTTVRPGSTIATTVAAGLVTITLDIGSDGAIDRTWAFPAAQLATTAG